MITHGFVSSELLVGNCRNLYGGREGRGIVLRRPWSMVTSLRIWMRRFAMIISAWWFRTSSAVSWQDLKKSLGVLEHWKLFKGGGETSSQFQ